MKHEHVIGCLIDKRRELMARVDQAQTLLRQLVMDLDALNATIRIFKPDIKLDRIRPKASPIKYAATKGDPMDDLLDPARCTRAGFNAAIKAACHGRAVWIPPMRS